MKKFLLPLVVALISLASCTDYTDDFNTINNRLDALEQSVPSIEEQIESINTQLTSLKATDEAIKEQIAELEKSDKATATEIADLKKKDLALEKSINDLQNYVDTQMTNAKSEAAAAYATVEQYNTIVAQLNALQSSTSKLGEELTAKINAEVKSLTDKIADLEARLKAVEDKIENLLARIQSVSYIPTYNDNKATLKYISGVSQVVLDFKVSPKECVAELEKVWENAVMIDAVYTETRAVSFVDMPIIKFEADAENGVISVIASGENLSEAFFAGTQSASASLTISDGNSSVTSEYVPMIAQEVDMYQLSVPANQIWYTSTDSNVVEPFNKDGFGAHIVSNTYKNGIGVITFNNNVTSIGSYVFNECTSLTSVTIPDGVTTIGEYAFYQCTALARINIPNSMTTIGEYSFRHCSSLKRVDITDLLAYLKISFNLYSGNPCRNGAKLYINDVEATEITIPSDITEITKCTFAGCASITSVTFHEGITSIGDYAFEYCSALANVTFDNCVTRVESSAFNGCTSLKRVDITNLSAWCKIAIQNTNTAPCRYGAKLYLNGEEVTELTIPADITKLGFTLFKGCPSLTSVTLHENVVSINSWAFNICKNLKSVYCKATTPPTARRGSINGAWGAFSMNASGRKIYVPTESVDAYKAANGWSDYADSIVGYDF